MGFFKQSTQKFISIEFIGATAGCKMKTHAIFVSTKRFFEGVFFRCAPLEPFEYNIVFLSEVF